MEQGWRLLVDAGGTNVRFGWSDETHQIHDAVSLPTRSFARFEDALAHYIGQIGGSTFSSAAIAGAGPVTDDEIRLTNNTWSIRAGDVAGILGGGIPVRLLNDLEAVAYALPHFEVNDVDWIVTPNEDGPSRQRMLAVNVGTGFGSSCVIRSPAGWVACPSESGHMTLGACDEAELAVHALLDSSPLSVEDVLSGDGVARLRAATTNADAWFGTWLARVSANLVLASASWDGVFFCGSVVAAWWRSADLAAFHRAFVGTGKMRDRLARSPVGLIQHDLPAFVGLSHLEI